MLECSRSAVPLLALREQALSRMSGRVEDGVGGGGGSREGATTGASDGGATGGPRLRRARRGFGAQGKPALTGIITLPGGVFRGPYVLRGILYLGKSVFREIQY